MNFLMITGNFRSGTTLLTKVLNIHPNFLLATDAFLYFFKRVRDRIYKEHSYGLWKVGQPMGDDFFTQYPECRNALLNADLNIPLTSKDKKALKEIDGTTAKLHPALAQGLKDIDASTFKEHFLCMMELLAEKYAQDSQPMVLGFKMAWLENLVPVMARTFPDMKFLMCYRDVRAVAASQNTKPQKRPHLFYARHWRKSIACINEFGSLDPTLKERVHPVCYESLVNTPEKELRSLCRFLNQEFNSSMLNVGQEKDETGQTWQPNTSYEQQPTGIFTKSTARWKTTLKPKEIDFLEWLCGPELVLQGYYLFPQGNTITSFFQHMPEPKFEELAPWLRDDESSSHVNNKRKFFIEMGKEMLRLKLLGDTTSNSSLPTELIESLFLFTSYFHILQKNGKRHPN